MQAQPPDQSAEEQLRVLVVDDYDDCRESMAMMLEIMGYRVMSARNGYEALETARAHRPFAVVTDIGMPIMDGFALASAIRADQRLRDAYVVAVSGWAENPSASRSAQAGFDRRLTKPAAWDALEGALNEARARVSLAARRASDERRYG